MMKVDWEDLLKGLMFTTLLAILFALFIYGFSTKTHQGYYLNCYEGQSKIMINWDNAPDETAFRTYNEKEALEVFKQLKEMDVNFKE
jgi:hypothetical protein